MVWIFLLRLMLRFPDRCQTGHDLFTTHTAYNREFVRGWVARETKGQKLHNRKTVALPNTSLASLDLVAGEQFPPPRELRTIDSGYERDNGVEHRHVVAHTPGNHVLAMH
jgi:hypothetical protein